MLPHIPSVVVSAILKLSGGLKMNIKWIKDAEDALNRAKDQKKPLLIDFSAAPA